jgi:ABC-type transport system involved in cytochrome bd biosynthesis fused ATPase/permease subunit
MSFIRRDWTTREADEWTKEDWIVIIISPVIYILVMIGVALSFLLLPVGFIILAIGIVATIIMHWIIDPKLKAISDEYERRQKEYISELERSVRWEKTDE